MTVIKSKRNEAKSEYLYTARELEIYTLKKCVHFPKRYSLYISQPMTQMAIHIYQYTKMADSIHPLNSHEFQLKRDYLLQANAELDSLVSQIELIQELFELNLNDIQTWMELVDKESRLLKNLLKEKNI